MTTSQAFLVSLRRLAAPATDQIEYLTSLGVADLADELALEFDDLYRPIARGSRSGLGRVGGDVPRPRSHAVQRPAGLDLRRPRVRRVGVDPRDCSRAPRLSRRVSMRRLLVTIIGLLTTWFGIVEMSSAMANSTLPPTAYVYDSRISIAVDPNLSHQFLRFR